MKLWPPNSNRRGFSTSNYLIDQLTLGKFHTYQGCQKGHFYFLSTYGHLTVNNGFSATNRLTVQLTSVKLDTLIRLTHRKDSLELIYHSYNYKHQQHITLYIDQIITKYQNINFTYQKNAYFILKPKTSLYQNFTSFNVLFIKKALKF